MLDFTNFDFEQLFGFGEDTNPLMMLIWIIPIIIFVVYGQRIQLLISSSEIKKSIKKLDSYQEESKNELVNFVQRSVSSGIDPKNRIEQFLDYFTVMPVDLDPNGIVNKVRHVVRSREDYTREHVRTLLKTSDDLILTKVQTLLEIATSLRMIYKVVNHLYLTAKKQNNYPLILPLQMMLPFIMEEAEGMKTGISAFKKGQPVGDSIGPMVVGKLMLDTKKKKPAFQTVSGEITFEDRKIILLKAEGPLSSVGRPGDAVEKIMSNTKIDHIIMIDASLKMEGEKSATVAQGFGAAIGGIGTERYQIEELATKSNIPVFAIVVKESIKEAITLMTKEIAEKADGVRDQVFEMIRDNTKPGQTILLIGVGNTIGVPQ